MVTMLPAVMVPADSDGTGGDDIQAGGIADGLVRQDCGRQRIDRNAAVKGVAHIEAGAVPRQGHGSAQRIGCVGRLIDRAAQLADDYVGGRRVLSRNLVVYQDAIVTAIGDEQPSAPDQGKAREVQGGVADGGVGRIAVAVVAVGRGTQDRGLLVRGIGRIGSERVVGDRAVHVGLPDDDIGAGVVRGRNGVPDEHAVVAEVGDNQTDSVGRHGHRVQEVLGGRAGLLLGEVRLDEGGEVRLAENHVGRDAIGGGYAVVDEDAVVLCIGNVEPAVLNPDSLRTTHGFRGRSVAAGRLELFMSGCPTTTSAAWLLMVGMRFQMSTRLWLVSATTTWTPSVATAVGRRRELGGGGEVLGGGGEIGLAEHYGGLADADRAFAGVGQFGGGAREHGRDSLVDQDAMVRGTGAYAVRVGHEEGIVGIRQTADAADYRVTGVGILTGERGLADDQPGGLSIRKTGGLPEQSGRAQKNSRDALHAQLFMRPVGKRLNHNYTKHPAFRFRTGVRNWHGRNHVKSLKAKEIQLSVEARGGGCIWDARVGRRGSGGHGGGRKI